MAGGVERFVETWEKGGGMTFGSDHPGEKIGRNPIHYQKTRNGKEILWKKEHQTLPVIPLPDIELTPLKTSTPTSRIAPPALIKGRVNDSLRFR